MASQSVLFDSCINSPSAPVRNSGIKIAINQVEYTRTSDGPVIHIFGRDVLGKSITIDVTGFRPYFYVPAEQAEALPASSHASLEIGTKYQSIRGEPLRRLFTLNPGDVREERERFKHFEADIPFATRFMIDTGLTGGVLAPSTNVDYKELEPTDVEAPARSCIIDIECEDERGFPDPQRDAIISITAFDSFPGDYVTFLLVGGGIPATIAEQQEAGGLVNG